MSVDEEDAVNGDSLQEEADDTVHQGCYRYVPRTANEEEEQRPPKRRKIAHPAIEAGASADLFCALLSGHESTKHAGCRQIAFRKCWTEVKDRIAHLLEPVNTAVLGEITKFVKDVPTLGDQERLATGLISCGPKAGPQTSLLEQWKSTQSEKKTAIVVNLDAAQAANLVAALKNLIRAAITQIDGADGYQTFLNERKRKIKMNYDLELLQEFVALRNVRKCVVYLTDVEAFDMVLLTDMILVISAWRDRIPFVLLLGISTTVDLLEARLPKSSIHLLECTGFDASVGADTCLDIYQSLYGLSHGLAVSLGPVVSGVLFEMSREHDASTASFSQAIKYTIMSHFFGNALSILREQDIFNIDVNWELCEAIRTTDSFRAYAEEQLNTGDVKGVRRLLNDDEALLDAAIEAVRNGQEAMSRHHAAVELFAAVLKLITPSEIQPDLFSIHVQALSGPSFLQSVLFTDLISKITTLPSDRTRQMLDAIHQHNESPELDIDTFQKKLDHIAPANIKIPLRSAYDPTHPTTSTTIKNNKVSLSKHGPQLSAKEIEYTHLVDQIADTLSTYFETNIRNPTTLFLHEAFVYDLKSPLGAVFTPRPHYATERALSTPYDYLGCECCEGRKSGQISATQPPTSILWQLWCEAGGIVNVRDLWNAFEAIVVERREQEDDDEEEEEEEDLKQGEETPVNGEVDSAEGTGPVDERMALALFYRGLAELRMMGFVRGTKRKADCLAKAAWRGL